MDQVPASVSPLSNLVIIGAGGHGREALDIVEAINRNRPTWKFLGFLADGEERPDLSAKRGVEILGGVRELARMDAFYVVGIGLASARKEIDEFATSLGKQSTILMHPSVIVGSQVQLSAGCVIGAGAILSTNIIIGRHTHLDLGVSVSHDARIGSYCTICPGVRIAGWVEIHDEVTIGIGATIRDRVKIGSKAVIGAGSVVINDVPSDVTVAGVPARPLHDIGSI